MAKFIKITDFKHDFANGSVTMNEYIINIDQIVCQYNLFNAEREDYERSQVDDDYIRQYGPTLTCPDRHIVMANGADYVIGEEEWLELHDIMGLEEAEWQGVGAYLNSHPIPSES